MPVMVVVPELANAYGLHEALVLRQLHYWLERATCHHDGKPWVYKSVSEWSEEFTWWSRSTVHKLLTTLAHDELITIRAADGRTYYTINYKNLRKDCQQALLMLSEIRTEESPSPVKPSENRTETAQTAVMSSEIQTPPSEIRTAHNNVFTEITSETTPEEEKEIAASAAPTLPPAVVVSEKPKRQRRQTAPPSSEAPPQQEPTEWQEFVGALCWLCHGHMELDSLTKEKRGALLSEAKEIHQRDFVVGDLREWYKRIWPKGWQWQKDRNARPSPADVRSSIAQLRAETPKGFDAVVPTSVPVNGSNAAHNRQAVENVIKRMKAQQVNGHG